MWDRWYRHSEGRDRQIGLVSPRAYAMRSASSAKRYILGYIARPAAFPRGRELLDRVSLTSLPTTINIALPLRPVWPSRLNSALGSLSRLEEPSEPVKP